MGGDFAPREVVRGAIDYASERSDHVILVGAGEQIEREIEEYGKGHPPRVSVVDAPEVIEMGDHPAAALRTKKRASVVVATELVHDDGADAGVPARSTCPTLAAAVFRLGTI